MNSPITDLICYWTLFLSILLPYDTYAGPTEQSIVMFRQLSTTEGLSNNSINSLCRDSRGFLWVGTTSGLNRHDSYTFQQYYQDTDNLPDNSITDILKTGKETYGWLPHKATPYMTIKPVSSIKIVKRYSGSSTLPAIPFPGWGQTVGKNIYGPMTKARYISMTTNRISQRYILWQILT